MTVNRDLREALTEFLENVGATNIDTIPWGKHPKLVYNWMGKQETYPIPRGNTSDRRIIDNLLRELRQKLGNPNPIEEEETPRRTLEEMMPELPANALPNLEPYRPQREEQMESVFTEFGGVAFYNPNKLRFIVPRTIADRFKEENGSCVEVKVCDNGWEIIPAEIGPEIRNYNKQDVVDYAKSDISYLKDLLPFGVSNAKYIYYPQAKHIIVDEPAVKKLTKAMRVPHKKWQEVTPKPTPILQPIILEPKVLGANWIVDWLEDKKEKNTMTDDDMRAVLYAARYIEEVTDYNVTRTREKGLVLDPKPSVKRID